MFHTALVKQDKNTVRGGEGRDKVQNDSLFFPVLKSCPDFSLPLPLESEKQQASPRQGARMRFLLETATGEKPHMVFKCRKQEHLCGKNQGDKGEMESNTLVSWGKKAYPLQKSYTGAEG